MQFAKRAIARLGMVAGVLVTIRRLKARAASTRILSRSEDQAGAAPPEAPAEACPLWSRSGARKTVRVLRELARLGQNAARSGPSSLPHSKTIGSACALTEVSATIGQPRRFDMLGRSIGD